ncbi:MAG: tetratricopeptide repeat protein [Candidatus Rokubacteria bacterium]|nr:tetratricopeptide repeat protein [Candidatus Rokubacteria bacterium]
MIPGAGFGGRRMRGAVLSLAVVVVIALAAPTGAAAQMTEAEVFVSQAVLDFEAKRYDEALASLRRALEIEPDHVEALFYLGAVYTALKRPDDAIAALERARSRAPADTAVALQLGLAYFAARDYDRAAPLLEEVFRARPTLDHLGYYVGFLRYRQKDYRRALEAFRQGRATDPEVQQLTRFYSGLALAALGLPSRAATEIDEALRAAPGSPLTAPIERMRDAVVAARSRERRLSAEVRVGGFHDDNVAVIPDQDRREPIVPLLRRPRHESSGELLGLRADYAWYRSEAVEATVGYSFFGTYNNDLPSFNVTDHLASTAVTYRTAIGSLPAQTTGQYAFDILFLDDDEFVQRHTVAASGALGFGDRHLSQAVTRYQRKDFVEDTPRPAPEEIRDADNWMIGAVHLLRFAEDRHVVRFGYQFDYEDASGRNYGYRGHRLVAGVQYTLPWLALRLRYDFDVHLRDYTAVNTILPTTRPRSVRRADEELTNVVRAELPLPWNLTLAAEYLSTINQSNLAVYDYTRNVVSLILSWSY